MKKLLRQIYNKCVKRYLPQSFRKKLKQADAQKYPIIMHPEEMYEKVYHIKDATWETFYMPDIYHFRKGLKGSLYHKAQDILLIDEECTLSPNTDVICTSHGVVWDKYYEDVFPYMKVSDENVYKHEGDTIWLRKADKEICVQGDCLSMFGTFSAIWAHFLIQFLPKLYYAEEAGLLDKDITLLLPYYEDSHVSYLVDKVLERHPKLKVLKDNPTDYRKVYRCQKLYYIPTASLVSNDYVYPSMIHYVIPERVIDIIKNNVVKSEIANLSHLENQNKKIYLVRRTYRVPSEIEKIEKFFEHEGFMFVEPHKLSFKEKVSIFEHASVIAGPHSSAWSNLIFANNNPKCLMFLSTNWIDDTYAGYLNQNFSYTLLQVTGNAEGKFEDIHFDHNNYDLTLEKVKNAYYELLQL